MYRWLMPGRPDIRTQLPVICANSSDYGSYFADLEPHNGTYRGSMPWCRLQKPHVPPTGNVQLTNGAMRRCPAD